MSRSAAPLRYDVVEAPIGRRRRARRRLAMLRVGGWMLFAGAVLACLWGAMP